MLPGRRATLTFCLGLTFLDSSARAQSPTPHPPKVLIFYTTPGMGHVSASKSIRDAILAKNPQAEVVMKDISELRPARLRAVAPLTTAAYFFMINRFPEFYEQLYHKANHTGLQAMHLEDLEDFVDHDALVAYLEQESPTAIVSTYFNATQALASLRAQGRLRGPLSQMPIGWLHTDYLKGFYPRLSKAIDQTFVAHRSLERQWQEEGVRPEAVTTTGMPVPENLVDPIDRESFLKSKGLDPAQKLIVITGGGEGLGDYPAYVKSIAHHVREPVQVVAVAGRNVAQAKKLREILKAGQLPANVKLVPLEMLPQAELLLYVKSADVYVTKGGGLSPTEAFAIGKPLITTDVISGHERANLEFFKAQNLALVNHRSEDLGLQVNELLTKPELRQRMSEAQAKFRDDMNLQKIVDFALAPPKRPETSVELEPFGPLRADDALARLDEDAPADLELILPLGQPAEQQGLRIHHGDSVYTWTRATHGPGGKLSVRAFPDFLYGKASGPGESSPGMSYQEDAVSLRLDDLPDPSGMLNDDAFLAKAQSIATSARNSTEFTEHLLAESGLPLPNQPLAPGRDRELFERILRAAIDQPNLGLDIVAYAQVRHPEGITWSRLPANVRPPRMPKATLTKRLSIYSGTSDIQYENLNGHSDPQARRALTEAQRELDAEAAHLIAQEKAVELDSEQLTARQLRASDLLTELRDTLAVLGPSGQ
jgi:UDP-N-acetylglucosamine:LPS N-acetylglucosamine transferase